jgi:hypothetical protein
VFASESSTDPSLSPSPRTRVPAGPPPSCSCHRRALPARSGSSAAPFLPPPAPPSPPARTQLASRQAGSLGARLRLQRGRSREGRSAGTTRQARSAFTVFNCIINTRIEDLQVIMLSRGGGGGGRGLLCKTSNFTYTHVTYAAPADAAASLAAKQRGWTWGGGAWLAAWVLAARIRPRVAPSNFPMCSLPCRVSLEPQSGPH